MNEIYDKYDRKYFYEAKIVCNKNENNVLHIWIYAVHSNNAEIIRFLEENKVRHSFDKVLIESIKCHHNSISNYIKDNFYEKNQEDNDNYFNDNFGEFVL